MKTRVPITTKPVANGSDGKDKLTGRFMPGNKFGKGDPFAKRVSEYRGILMQTVTRKRMKSIILALAKSASRGDVCAAKVLLDRCLGKCDVDVLRVFTKRDDEFQPDERFL
jgi:hypothetical protein